MVGGGGGIVCLSPSTEKSGMGFNLPFSVRKEESARVSCGCKGGGRRVGFLKRREMRSGGRSIDFNWSGEKEGVIFVVYRKRYRKGAGTGGEGN